MVADHGVLQGDDAVLHDLSRQSVAALVALSPEMLAKALAMCYLRLETGPEKIALKGVTRDSGGIHLHSSPPGAQAMELSQGFPEHWVKHLVVATDGNGRATTLVGVYGQGAGTEYANMLQFIASIDAALAGEHSEVAVVILRHLKELLHIHSMPWGVNAWEGVNLNKAGNLMILGGGGAPVPGFGLGPGGMGGDGDDDDLGGGGGADHGVLQGDDAVKTTTATGGLWGSCRGARGCLHDRRAESYPHHPAPCYYAAVLPEIATRGGCPACCGVIGRNKKSRRK